MAEPYDDVVKVTTMLRYVAPCFVKTDARAVVRHEFNLGIAELDAPDFQTLESM